MTYVYWEAADGSQFGYSTTPTLVCPYASGPPIVLADEAARLGLDLPLAWPSRYRHGGDGPRCVACGAELERAGFDASVRLSRTPLGGIPTYEITKRERFPLRREAKAWAHEEFKVYAAQLAEATP